MKITDKTKYNILIHEPKSCVKPITCLQCAHYIFNCQGRNPKGETT